MMSCGEQAGATRCRIAVHWPEFSMSVDIWMACFTSASSLVAKRLALRAAYSGGDTFSRQIRDATVSAEEAARWYLFRWDR